jgi:hypothetical protein
MSSYGVNRGIKEVLRTVRRAKIRIDETGLDERDEIRPVPENWKLWAAL